LFYLIKLQPVTGAAVEQGMIVAMIQVATLSRVLSLFGHNHARRMSVAAQL